MKSVIFDMDGTLLESMGVWARVGDEYLKRNGIPQTYTVDLAESDKTYNEKIQMFIDGNGLRLTVAELKPKLDGIMAEKYANSLQLKPYAKEFIELLSRKGVPMCVATATPRELASVCFHRLGVEQYFTGILSTRDTGIGKTDPDIYFRAAKLLRSEPAETAVFEDVLHGVRTAKAAGFRTVGVYEPQFAKDFPEIQRLADRTIRSFSELL